MMSDLIPMLYLLIKNDCVVDMNELTAIINNGDF